MPNLQLSDCVQLKANPGETFVVGADYPDNTCSIFSLPFPPGARWLYRVPKKSLRKVPPPCARLHKRPDEIASGRCSLCGRKL